MSAIFEGDLVRPLGFVTLYSAYAEAAIDVLLQDLSPEGTETAEQSSWLVGSKLAEARRRLTRLNGSSESALLMALDEARALFDRRNALVHSCIFAKDRVVPNRPDSVETTVSAADLIALADAIFACKEQIDVQRQRELPLLVAQSAPNNSLERSRER